MHLDSGISKSSKECLADLVPICKGHKELDVKFRCHMNQ